MKFTVYVRDHTKHLTAALALALLAPATMAQAKCGDNVECQRRKMKTLVPYWSCMQEVFSSYGLRDDAAEAQQKRRKLEDSLHKLGLMDAERTRALAFRGLQLRETALKVAADREAAGADLRMKDVSAICDDVVNADQAVNRLIDQK
jgi:hypothetical protein